MNYNRLAAFIAEERRKLCKNGHKIVKKCNVSETLKNDVLT